MSRYFKSGAVFHSLPTRRKKIRKTSVPLRKMALSARTKAIVLRAKAGVAAGKRNESSAAADGGRACVGIRSTRRPARTPTLGCDGDTGNGVPAAAPAIRAMDNLDQIRHSSTESIDSASARCGTRRQTAIAPTSARIWPTSRNVRVTCNDWVTRECGGEDERCASQGIHRDQPFGATRLVATPWGHRLH